MKIPKINKHYMGRDAHRDWVAIFIFTCVISVALIVDGVASYRDVDSKLSNVAPQASGTNLPVDSNTLDNAIKVIDTHAANQKSIINATIPLAPS